MSEATRFRWLCRVARLLGFDLSQVTPGELHKPSEREWYVWKENLVEGWRVTKDSRPMWCSKIFGPMTRAEADYLMCQKNGLNAHLEVGYYEALLRTGAPS